MVAHTPFPHPTRHRPASSPRTSSVVMHPASSTHSNNTKRQWSSSTPSLCGLEAWRTCRRASCVPQGPFLWLLPPPLSIPPLNPAHTHVLRLPAAHPALIPSTTPLPTQARHPGPRRVRAWRQPPRCVHRVCLDKALPPTVCFRHDDDGTLLLLLLLLLLVLRPTPVKAVAAAAAAVPHQLGSDHAALLHGPRGHVGLSTTISTTTTITRRRTRTPPLLLLLLPPPPQPAKTTVLPLPALFLLCQQQRRPGLWPGL